MSSVVRDLARRQLLGPAPGFVAAGLQYEVIMGSIAYGVSNDGSDLDLYGFCIPPQEQVFPHLGGEIVGFDDPAPRFEQYQRHHIHDRDALGGRGRRIDLTIYSVVKFFRLCMDNNPNIVDALFVPPNCVLHAGPAGELLRERRRQLLHKGAWHKFKGYAYQQLHKIRTKRPRGGRRETVERYGYDVKFAYHVVRLLNEVEQLLTEGDLSLDRNREQLKAVRRGDWTLAELEDYFARKEPQLEALYQRSSLPPGPDRAAVKTLLLEVLEQHYGSFGKLGRDDRRALQALREIDQVLGRVRGLYR